MSGRAPRTIAAGNRKRTMTSARTDIPGTLTMTFINGKQLLNRLTFGCSDPYVKVFDPLGNLIFATEHKGSTQDPKWEEEGKEKENKNVTSLRLYEGEGAIRLEAWDKNTLADAPLGQVEVPVTDLIGLNGVRSFQLSPGPDEEDTMVRENRNSLGTLTLRFAYREEPLTTQKAEQIENPDYRLPTILHVRVAAAMNLMNREKTGTSDPYVTVLAPDGATLLKTPTMRSTLNPQYTDRSNGDISCKVRVKHGSVGNLTFQVWDSNAISDDPMGEVQVPVTTAVELSQRAFAGNDTQHGPRISLILRPREREEDEILAASKPGQLGTLMVNFKSAPESLAEKPSEPPGILSIAIDACKNLIKRRVVGKTQHFVKVIELRTGDKKGTEIFETHTSETSARNPRWRETEATTEARLIDNDSLFIVQVWDKGTVSDVFLGEARITSKDALKHATEPESELKLVPRAADSDRDIRSEALGTIILQFRFKNDLEYHAKHEQLQIARPKAVLLDPPGCLTVEVINCRGLQSRSENFALSPFVTIVDPYGNDVHKTSVQRDTNEPKFEGEEPALVRLARKKGTIAIQVWDKRTLGADFLGETVLTVEDAIAYVGVSNPTFVLRPRVREEDKWVRENANDLGVITMSLRFSADQTPVPAVPLPAENRINGVFTITVKGCKELCNFESTGTSDPFVRVKRGEGGNQVHKLPKCKTTLNPEWGAKNVFDVAINTDRLEDPGYAVVLEVWDHNALIDDRMGSVVLFPSVMFRYATGLEVGNDVIDMPLRLPLTEKDQSSKLVKNEHKLGTMQIQIEFKEGNDNKTAAEIEREELFNMDVPLEYVISHIERTHESSLLSRELMLYIPFLVMFIFFSLARRDTLQEHYIAGGFAQQFTLHEIPPTLYHDAGGERFNGLHHYTAWWELQTLSELHSWIEGVVAPHFWDWRHPQEPSKLYGPFGFNKALGAIRFRSRKVRPDSCIANTAFIPENNTLSYNTDCFDSFKADRERKDPLYYPAGNYTVKFDDTCPHSFTYIEGDLYRMPCGGYIVDLPLSDSFNNSLTQLRNLRFMGFINETDTRFFVIEWFTYNPALDMFTGSKYFIEITNGGGWILTAQLRSFRVAVGGPVNFFFIYDIFFTLFVAYYWIKFFRDWRRYYKRTKLGLEYLLSVWTFLEIANLAVFAVALGFHFEWYRACWEFEDNIHLKDPDDYPVSLDYIMALFYGEIFSNAANSVLSFLKILKFLKMNSKLNILTRTMGRATENIMGVLAIFFLIMTAYALSGVQLYGTQLFEFRDVGSAMSTLFRALMGSFDYEELRVKNRATTFFYFWSFIIIGLFVMLNFITAIIGSAYEAEQDAENTLPIAIQIRRTLRELKALSVSRFIDIFWESVVKRSRRHPDDIIFEHISQYRSTLLARDDVDEDAIRRGEESAPDYLINYHKFKCAIPKSDAEYIGFAVVDNTYHAIAEDFAVLHHDDEKETEDALAVTFQDAIEVGFRKVLIDRLPEITAVQRCLLTGESLPLMADQGNEVDRLATDEAGDAAVKRISGGGKGSGPDATDRSLAELSAKVRASDSAGAKRDGGDSSANASDAMSTAFDARASTEKLMTRVAVAREATLAPAQVRAEEAIPTGVREEQRRLVRVYLETYIGGGRTGAGVYRAAEETAALTNLVSNVHEVTCARSFQIYDHLVASGKARTAAEAEKAAQAQDGAAAA